MSVMGGVGGGGKIKFNKAEMSILASQPGYRFDKEGVLLVRERQEGFFRRNEKSQLSGKVSKFMCVGPVGKAFLERWCRLRGNLLFYFKSKDQWSEPAGVIVLENVSVDIDPDPTGGETSSYGLLLTWPAAGQQQPQYLGCGSLADRESWRAAILCASHSVMRRHLASLQLRLNELNKVLSQSQGPPGARAPMLAPSSTASVAIKMSVIDPDVCPLLECCFSCDNLLCDAIGRAPSARLVIFVRNSTNQLWTEYTNTEVVERTSNPTFMATTCFRSTDGVGPTTQVRICAQDLREKLTVVRTLLGSTSTTISELLNSEKMRLRLESTNPEGRGAGFVTIHSWTREKEGNSASTESTPVHHGTGSSQNGGWDGPMSMANYHHKRSLSLPPAIYHRTKNPRHPHLKLLYSSPLIKTYRLHSGLGGDISALELMAEPRLAFIFPQQLLSLWIAEEKELVHEIAGLGELREPWHSCQMRWLENHLNLINVYTTALENLENYRGPNFRKSKDKTNPAYEFVPTNLHLQRLWAENESLRKSGFYDIHTVGVFSALTQKTKSEGLIRMLKELKSPQKDSTAWCSLSDRLLMAEDSLAAVRKVRREVVDCMRILMKLAKEKESKGMFQLVEDMLKKTKLLCSISDTSLVDDAFGFLETNRVTVRPEKDDFSDSVAEFMQRNRLKIDLQFRPTFGSLQTPNTEFISKELRTPDPDYFSPSLDPSRGEYWRGYSTFTSGYQSVDRLSDIDEFEESFRYMSIEDKTRHYYTLCRNATPHETPSATPHTTPKHEPGRGESAATREKPETIKEENYNADENAPDKNAQPEIDSAHEEDDISEDSCEAEGDDLSEAEFQYDEYEQHPDHQEEELADQLLEGNHDELSGPEAGDDQPDVEEAEDDEHDEPVNAEATDDSATPFEAETDLSSKTQSPINGVSTTHDDKANDVEQSGTPSGPQSPEAQVSPVHSGSAKSTPSHHESRGPSAQDNQGLDEAHDGQGQQQLVSTGGQPSEPRAKSTDNGIVCDNEGSSHYRSGEEPEPIDLTHLNIEASMMCLASKVRSLCGRADSPTLCNRTFRFRELDSMKKPPNPQHRHTATLTSSEHQDGAESESGAERPALQVPDVPKPSTDDEPIDWAGEVRPSMRKLRQGMDSLLKTSRLLCSVLRLQQQEEAVKLTHTIKYRRDVCFSQALTSLVTALMCRLWCHQEADLGFIRLLTQLGPLVSFESLLSMYGNETTMLNDMIVAVEDLRSVEFSLVLVERRTKSKSAAANISSSASTNKSAQPQPAAGGAKNLPTPTASSAKPPTGVPVTSAGASASSNRSGVSCASTKNPAHSSCLAGTNSATFPLPRVTGSRNNLKVLLPVPDWVYSQIPVAELASTHFSITPVFFNIGINEKATVAEKLGLTAAQEKNNLDNFRILTDYVRRYKRLGLFSLPDHREDSARSGRFSRETQVSDLMSILKSQVTSHRSKNADILDLASQICHKLNGIRFTNCKSGKDRTGMAVTLEEVNTLSREYDLADNEYQRALDTFRSEGVRIRNCGKNIGLDKYAFLTLQLHAFPRQYRAPVGSYGSVPS